ncbi:uncharacterized protein [Spinacia oleracea]|nr:uncharacterized protein LOC110804570 isoform X2 [Spinacia oleracea]
MSTVIIHDPNGARANALTDWALTHQDILANRQARVLDVRNPSPLRVIITLDDLNQKTNINTIQEERLWVKVVVPELDFDRVHAYIGCCNCGRRTDVPVGKAYTCTNCSQKGSMACPRVTTNCDISDSTGTRSVTMFTSDSETLFRMPAEDIFRIKHTKDDIAIKAATEMVRTKPILVQLGPTVALSKSNALQWCLKKVALEENTEEASEENEENDQAALEASEENDQAALENTAAPKK